MACLSALSIFSPMGRADIFWPLRLLLCVFAAFFQLWRFVYAFSRLIVILLSAACFLLLSEAKPATAFSLFGIHLWGKKAEETVVDPKSYTVEFAPLLNAGSTKNFSSSAAAENAIHEQFAASEKIARKASTLWAGRKKSVSGSGGLLTKAQGDYVRIIGAFYAAGFYGPVISIRINGREAADIPFGTELPKENKILIRVNGGASYKFSKAFVNTVGPVSPYEEQIAQKKIKKAADKLGYKVGDIAESGKIFATQNTAVGQWQAQGYAKATIAGNRLVVDHAAKLLSADIDVAPGRQARFGTLTVNNVSKKPSIDSDYIAWMTGLKKGQLYSPKALSKANARLRRLEVFSTASLTEAETISANGLLPLTLTLQERPKRRFGGGGSYSTIDGVGVSAYWMHRNLFGHAERLRFDAAVSNIAGNRNKSSAKPSDYTYSLGTTFVRPGIFTPDTNYIASLKAEREVLDNYKTKGIYFSNGFNHNFNDLLSGYIYAQASKVEVEDDIWGKRNFTTMGLLSGLLFDNRDNKNDATKGFYGEVTAQPFYEAKYGNFINKMTAEGRTYLALTQTDRLVFALRGKIGTISGAPISELPSNMLFFIGGGGSVRGYAYRSIGVSKKGDNIIGGRSMVEGSAELRAMVTRAFGVVGFVDAGVVGKKSAPDFDQNTKVGAGLGIRYKTGMGPLRVDVALPLNREKGDSRYGLYIGIGQAF